MLPPILRITASAKGARKMRAHHIDWNQPGRATKASQP
jgi:hypothetical protein